VDSQWHMIILCCVMLVGGGRRPANARSLAVYPDGNNGACATRLCKLRVVKRVVFP